MKTYIASFIISIAAYFTFSPKQEIKETAIVETPIPRVLTSEEIIKSTDLYDTVERLNREVDSLTLRYGKLPKLPEVHESRK